MGAALDSFPSLCTWWLAASSLTTSSRRSRQGTLSRSSVTPTMTAPPSATMCVSFTFNDWVQPLPLPAQGQETEAGTSCTVTGWGTTSEGGFILPNKLHKVDVPVVSDEECNVAYADSNPILDSMICAG